MRYAYATISRNGMPPLVQVFDSRKDRDAWLAAHADDSRVTKASSGEAVKLVKRTFAVELNRPNWFPSTLNNEGITHKACRQADFFEACYRYRREGRKGETGMRDMSPDEALASWAMAMARREEDARKDRLRAQRLGGFASDSC